jgi:DNA-binding NtrC family response regulator
MNVDATIFIVDDDIAMRDSLALLLGLKGFRTQIFANAENLLTAYNAKWFGCMLVDVRMPGMTGLELHAELCKRGNDVPVVIMTAYGDVATARSALKAGATDFLEKPVDDGVLIATANGPVPQGNAAIDDARAAGAGSRGGGTSGQADRGAIGHQPAHGRGLQVAHGSKAAYTRCRRGTLARSRERHELAFHRSRPDLVGRNVLKDSPWPSK